MRGYLVRLQARRPEFNLSESLIWLTSWEHLTETGASTYMPKPSSSIFLPTSFVDSTSIVLHSSINLFLSFLAATTPDFLSRYTALTCTSSGTMLIRTLAFSAASRAVGTISILPKEMYWLRNRSHVEVLISFMYNVDSLGIFWRMFLAIA
jgi:hypothetical protein